MSFQWLEFARRQRPATAQVPRNCRFHKQSATFNDIEIQPSSNYLMIARFADGKPGGE